MRGLLAASALFLAACGDSRSDPAAPGCEAVDLPERFFQQVAGDFTTADIASLASDRGLREEDLVEAGASGGAFSFWSERVGRPPFDPPGEVVCQSLGFTSEEDARAFLAELDTDAGAAAVTGLAWLPGDDPDVTDSSVREATLPDGARALVIMSEGGGRSTEVVAVAWVSGSHVMSIYSGETPGPADAAMVAEVARSVAERVGGN